jgi:membrane protein implicated in regulation of membrane protease activity
MHYFPYSNLIAERSPFPRAGFAYIIIYKKNMNKRLTLTRFIMAVISTGLEEVAIWAIWRWVLPDFGIKWPFQALLAVMVAWAAFGTWLFILTTRTIGKQAPAGLPSMVGGRGRAVGRLDPEGLVKIRGELWGAVSEGGEIREGEEVIVTGEDGLKLTVRKAGDQK